MFVDESVAINMKYGETIGPSEQLNQLVVELLL